MSPEAARDLATELGRLVAEPGPPGAEQPVAAVVAAGLEDVPGDVVHDSLGNVRLLPAGRPRVLVTAHMDQVGYMVSRLEDGRAHCLPVGGPSLAEFETTAVRIVGDDHLPLDGEFQSLGKAGGVLRSGQLGDVRVGDCVVFAGPLETEDGGHVRGPALDDRIGCLVALRAARMLAGELADVAFAWTVREESEQAGVIRVVRDLEPDVVVAVDITFATSADQHAESIVALGGGPAITLLDGGMVGARDVVRAFDRAARGLGTAWQPEVVRGGVSEAGRVHRLLGVPALALLVPIENAHSPNERANLADVSAVIDLLVAGVRVLTGDAKQAGATDVARLAAASTPDGR
jgi:putative aminopeptidase FrvX